MVNSRFQFLSPIIDEVERSSIIQKSSSIVVRPNNLSLEWLSRHSWAAVPVEESISPTEAASIALAIHSLEITSCFALTTELNDDSDTLFRLPVNEDAIYEIRYSYLGLVNVLIYDGEISFSIMKDAGLYVILSGPMSFVRQALGCSIDDARLAFDDYAANNDFPVLTKNTLRSVADKYRSFNG